MNLCVCGHPKAEHSSYGPKPCISIVMSGNEKPKACFCSRYSEQAAKEAS